MTPFSNLTGDASFDWMSVAGGQILAEQLANAPRLEALSVDSTDGAYEAHATGFLHAYLVSHAGDLELHSEIENATSHRTVADYVDAGAAAEGPFPLLDRLARRLFPSARNWPAAQGDAFLKYVQALEQSSAEARARGAEDSLRADPTFFPAAVLRARSLLALGQPDAAARTASDALGRASDLDPVARAQLEYLAVSDVHDRRVQIEKLRSVAQLMPAHPDLLRSIGQLQFFARDFSASAASFESAVAIDPADPGAWNLLGYSRSFNGDLKGARAALEKYAGLLPPSDANALDSLGEANFFLGDFASAERDFLAAEKKKAGAADGTEILKAAAARYFTGDLPGADGIFSRYIAVRKSRRDPLVFIEQAQWDYLAGRRDKAIDEIAPSPGLTGDPTAYAQAQLSLWKRNSGDIPDAIRLASDAARLARGQPVASLALVVRFLAQPPAQVAPRSLPPALQGALGYNLFLSGRYAQAAPILEALLGATNPSSDGQVRTLLAACYIQAGKWDQARALTLTNPLPFKAGDVALDWLAFPRWFQVKAAVLEHDAKAEDAARLRRLFLQYGGEDRQTH